VKGTIIEHTPKRGRKTFGFSLFLGRDETGKQLRQVKRGFRREKDAEEALRKAIEERERTPAAERAMPTFAEFAARWFAEGNPREWSPKTLERAKQLADYGIRLFGDAPLDQLTVEQLATAINRLLDRGGQATKQHPHGRPLAPKTVRHIAFTIQGCLQQAVDWDIIARNPMQKVRKPKVPRRRPKVVDRDGFDALFAKCADRRMFPAIVLDAATGMRRGELLAVEWPDLDWAKGVLEISKSLEETKAGLRVKSTKSGHARRIALPAEVLDVLREHQRAQEEDRKLYGPDYANLRLVFCRPDGFYYNPDKFGVRVRRAMQAAGLHGVSLHSLRHSHASELLSQGAPITAVAERLGHASANVTLGIYSHALPADNQATAKLWNDAMASVIATARKRRAGGGLPQVITGGRGKTVIPLKSAS
jgi:integrase